MNNTLMWVVIAALVAIVLLGIMMGPRLKKAKFNIGKSFSSEMEGTSAGPVVLRADALGEENRITADGAGARVEDATAVGKGNVIGAGTSGTTKTQSH